MKLITLLFISLFSIKAYSQKVSIIPKPVELIEKDGAFDLDQNVYLESNSDKNKDLIAYFSQIINNISGFDVTKDKASKKSIHFIVQEDKKLGSEGYKLNVNPNKIEIIANNNKGLFYGIQSLIQTFPNFRSNEKVKIPCMQVVDYPRFEWRGMHLDVSRHFFGPEVIKKYIDLMATYKLNVFHWHLVDDQGWRIEIKKYPKLTEIGAWRFDNVHIPWRERPQAKQGDPSNYGGFYTQKQIKEIIEYAQARNIMILPEIEMPGHVASVVASYPELSCTEHPQLSLTGGQYKGVNQAFCAGKESTFEFIQNVLDEVIELFPSKYIHIGGDELRKEFWKECKKCQDRIKKEKLKDEDELQSYFIKRIEKYLISKNRKLIGWDEILEGGLAKSAIVMSWRGEIGGIESAKMGHQVIMTPEKPVYFDHYQADPEHEIPAIGGFNTLKNVYNYEPIPKELTEEQGKLVLGAQANLWTEFITSSNHLFAMLLPRMIALSETVWTPKKDKNWNDFNTRLQKHLKGFDANGTNYSKGNTIVEINPENKNNKLTVNFDSEVYNAEIYYTTDGTLPNSSSLKYQNPIEINKNTTIKAIPFVDGFQVGKSITEQSFVIHKATNAEIKYKIEPNKKYPANGNKTILDGIKGTINPNKFWLAFDKQDFEAVIDLKSEQEISNISAGFLQLYGNWIFIPRFVNIEYSSDGKNFKQLAFKENPIDIYEKRTTYNFDFSFNKTKARFVKIVAKNTLTPAKHSRPGNPGWIFIDEIYIN